MRLPKGYKADLWEFQQQVKRMRALKPFEAYERQFVQDRIKNHVGDVSPIDVLEWITKNLDVRGGGDATGHGGDILEAAVFISRGGTAKKRYLRDRGGRKNSTVAYFLKGGY